MRYLPVACCENKAWSSGGNRGNCMYGIQQVTAGGHRLACLHRVCYKFVAELGLTTKCLSSIFLRAK